MITNKTSSGSSQLRAASGAEEVAAWKETVPGKLRQSWLRVFFFHQKTTHHVVAVGLFFGFILVDFSTSHDLNKNHEKRAQKNHGFSTFFVVFFFFLMVFFFLKSSKRIANFNNFNKISAMI